MMRQPSESDFYVCRVNWVCCGGVCVCSLPDIFLAMCLTLRVLASFIVDSPKTVQYNIVEITKVID